MPTMICSLAALLLTTGAAAGVDLSQCRRSPDKEPAYRSKPRYCLLVFGPEAKTRVWLVQDGDTLYVDRKGDGDLTAAGDKVVAEKENADEVTHHFKVGDIRDGGRLHKDLHLYVVKLDRLADQDDDLKALLRKDPKARGYLLNIEVDMPGRKGTGVSGRVPHRGWYADVNGVLQFAERPAEAPILHFGGPWQVALFGRQELRAGRETDVVLGVGSPGIGPGSTTWIDYEGVIPTDKYPTLDIIYPAKRTVDAPLQEHYELKQRC
jgi:hypothetical protein